MSAPFGYGVIANKRHQFDADLTGTRHRPGVHTDYGNYVGCWCSFDAGCRIEFRYQVNAGYEVANVISDASLMPAPFGYGVIAIKRHQFDADLTGAQHRPGVQTYYGNYVSLIHTFRMSDTRLTQATTVCRHRFSTNSTQPCLLGYSVQTH